MIWKLLGGGLFGARKYGGKVVVIFALVSLVVTSPYWSQLGAGVPMEMSVVEADVGWTPMPMQPAPGVGSDAQSSEQVDASAKFDDWDCPWKSLFVREAARVDMPWQLLSSLAWFESGYQTNAVSSAGARGISQFMEGTWREVMGTPFSNAYDPEQSIIAMATYMETLRAEWWDDDWSHDKIVAHMLASYCWGTGNVRRKGIGSTPASVRRYVDQILSATGYETFFK